VAKNINIALHYYQMAAENGYDEAQYTLGLEYLCGVKEIIEKDLSKAKLWFKLAADQGHATSVEIMNNFSDYTNYSQNFLYGENEKPQTADQKAKKECLLF